MTSEQLSGQAGKAIKKAQKTAYLILRAMNEASHIFEHDIALMHTGLAQDSQRNILYRIKLSSLFWVSFSSHKIENKRNIRHNKQTKKSNKHLEIYIHRI